MRKSLLAAVSLVTSTLTMFAAAAGPAAADPASAATASASGLTATGLLAISPTPTTAAALPPGQDTGISPTLITLPLSPLTLTAVAGVNASAHSPDDITPFITTVPAAPDLGNAVTLSPVNARGFATTAVEGLVFTAAPGEADPILLALSALQSSLLGARAIDAEAVARCVNNQPVFETGFRVLGLTGIVGGVIDPLVQTLLSTLLGLLSEDPAAPAPLSAVISITPGVVTQTATSVSIVGLRVRIPLLNQVIDLSTATATMPAGCGVAAPATTVAPDRGRLASTGTDTPLLPIGAGLIGAAAVGYAVVRRSRRTAAE